MVSYLPTPLCTVETSQLTTETVISAIELANMSRTRVTYLSYLIVYHIEHARFDLDDIVMLCAKER